MERDVENGSFSTLERLFLECKERIKSDISTLEQGSQLVGGERGFLASSLNFDVLAVAGLDDVHVNVGVGVEYVIQVKVDFTVDQTDGNGRKVVGNHRVLVVFPFESVQGRGRPTFFSLLGGWPKVNGKAHALSDESADGQTQGDVRRRDGGAAGAPVSVEDVAIHVECNGSERLQINGGTE